LFEAGAPCTTPQTETQGRVHTSAATMVLPEAEEFDVQIDMNDVRRFFLFFRPGGQSVNDQISSSFNAYSNRLVAQCQDQNHNIKIKTRHLAFCVPVYTSRN
jgi:peptide chain release factor 1